MFHRATLIALLLALAACSNTGASTSSGSCADAVRQLRTSSEMGVQGGGKHQTAGRATADIYLQQAADAASRGDEATCRRSLDQARTVLTY